MVRPCLVGPTRLVRGLPMGRQFFRKLHMGRVIPELEPDLAQKLREGDVHPKRIPTRRNMGFTKLPAQLEIAAMLKLKSFSSRRFRQDASELLRVMYKLKLPDDRTSVALKRADIKAELVVRGKEPQPEPDAQFTLQEDTQRTDEELKDLIEGKLEPRRRDWHYYEYDDYASALYMACRLAPNYACLRTVMKEIHDLDIDFKPKSVLDFGSGMGTTIWAVNETWPNSVDEFLNVDLSVDQQQLCEFLLRGGQDLSHDQLQGVFHRQYLPSSNRIQYDMVVAAFSLLDQPNADLRAQIVENLWHKTNDFLVIVDRGNPGGFAVVNEARHQILDLAEHKATHKLRLTLKSSQPLSERHIPQAHVFSPCPHEFGCPRATMSTKLDRNFCHFRVQFEPIEYGVRKPGCQAEKFSYVVLRKGPHPIYSCPKIVRWPRIVEPRRKGSGHIIHRMCCPNGLIAETTITKAKYGKEAYGIAKASDWGDILPIKVADNYVSKNRSFNNGKNTVDETIPITIPQPPQ